MYCLQPTSVALTEYVSLPPRRDHSLSSSPDIRTGLPFRPEIHLVTLHAPTLALTLALLLLLLCAYQRLSFLILCLLDLRPRLGQPLALAPLLLAYPGYGSRVLPKLVLGVSGGRIRRIVRLEGLFEDGRVNAVFLDVMVVQVEDGLEDQTTRYVPR